MYLAVNLVSFLTVKKIENLSTILTKLPSAMQCLHFLDHPVHEDRTPTACIRTCGYSIHKITQLGLEI